MRMSEEEVGKLTFDLRSDFSDVGHYSYGGLCAYALNRLYGGSQWDKEFAEKCLKSVVAHLGQKPQFQEAMVAIATGVAGLEEADPFILSLMAEEAIVAHGPAIVPQDFLMLVLKEGCYDSRMRTLAKYVTLLLKVDWDRMVEFEDLVMESFKEEEHELSEEEKKEKEKAHQKQKIKRYALIGLATVGGGTLIGLTGGLAAPFIAAGAGTIIGATGAAALGSAAGVAIIGSLFGVAGAGLGAYKMKKRVGGVEEFEFEPLSEGRQLAVSIAVSGWITEECPDFKAAWRGLDNSREQYVLKYESRYLKQMGLAMDYLLTIAMTAAAQETLKYTVLSGILAAIAWPAALLSAANVIDNPWGVCTQRTVNVGRQLAEVLLSRQQGKRPVTLVGFSLGARVIFYCLQEMAKRKNCEGIVEDVILLGTPCTGDPGEWAPFARVVAGKIINGYCRGDWLLKFLYRTASIQYTVAGLAPVEWEDRRMHNIDLSDIVSKHIDYMTKIDEILSVVGIRTKEHAVERTGESLKQWVNIQKSRSGSSLRVGSRGASQDTTPNPSPRHRVRDTGGAIEEAADALEGLHTESDELAESALSQAVREVAAGNSNHKAASSRSSCDTRPTGRQSSVPPDAGDSGRAQRAGAGSSASMETGPLRQGGPEDGGGQEGADSGGSGGEGLLDTANADVTTPDSGIFLAPSPGHVAATTPDSGIE